MSSSSGHQNGLSVSAVTGHVESTHEQMSSFRPYPSTSFTRYPVSDASDVASSFSPRYSAAGNNASAVAFEPANHRVGGHHEGQSQAEVGGASTASTREAEPAYCHDIPLESYEFDGKEAAAPSSEGGGNDNDHERSPRTSE